MPFLGTITYPGSLSNSTFVDSGFEYCKCSPLPEEMIQFDERIFQRGWFNHQLVLKMMIFPPSHFAGILDSFPGYSKHHDSYAVNCPLNLGHLPPFLPQNSSQNAWCRFWGSWQAFPVKCGLIGRFKAYFWPGELFCVHVNLEKMLKRLCGFILTRRLEWRYPQTWNSKREVFLEGSSSKHVSFWVPLNSKSTLGMQVFTISGCFNSICFIIFDTKDRVLSKKSVSIWTWQMEVDDVFCFHNGCHTIIPSWERTYPIKR